MKTAATYNASIAITGHLSLKGRRVMPGRSPAQLFCTVKTSDRRRGALLTELLVATALLSSIMAVAAPMSIKLMRVRKSHQQRMIAVEELTNQLERLTILTTAELNTVPSELTPPDYLAEQLHELSITFAVSPANDRGPSVGQRVTVGMTWTDSVGVRTTPLRLTTWVYPAGGDS